MDVHQAVAAFYESPEAPFNRLPIEEHSSPERVLYVLEWLEAEVNNGGFHQYLFNSAGDHAGEAVGACEAIGAHQTADIVRRALKVVFGVLPPPVERWERVEILEGIGEANEDALHDLDNEFYEYPDDIASLTYAYIDANRASIRGTLPPVGEEESEPESTPPFTVTLRATTSDEPEESGSIVDRIRRWFRKG
ncbi:MAG: DMP19 family protein [Fimbriimonas sp.]